MKNNPESGEFCFLHICLFNNGKAIHFRTTLTPLRLLFLLLFNIGVRFWSVTKLQKKKKVPLYTGKFISLNAFLMYPKSYFLCPLYYVTHETVTCNKTRCP